LRTGGNAGECSVDYATADISAAAGRDYTAVDDTLTFKPGEVRKELHIEIIDDNVPEKDEKFRVVLKNAMGAVLEEAAAIAIVTIKQTEEDKRNYTLAYRLAAGDKCKSVMEQWKDQFKVAMSAAGDGDEPVTGGMMATHVLTVFFKVTFAVVPPTPLWGGWAAFVVGILMIAVVTMMISDLATFFGCVVGLPISINAITLVGVGTSLPDTFASKRAAIDDDTADNSIGNITGSNCVNVFLGLGLPWMIGALYWSAVGRTELWEAKYGHLDLAQGLAPDEAIFVVPAGGLVFSVIIFVVCALTALLVLQGRRMAYGGELGGPAGPKKVHAVFLVSLWLIYLMMSILYDVGVIPPIS
jgi:solute carrier family 8 (sodium/calcium exchanger)